MASRLPRKTNPPHYGETVRFGQRQLSEDRRRADTQRNKELVAVVALAAFLIFIGVVAFMTSDKVTRLLFDQPAAGGFACFISVILLMMVCSVILLIVGERGKHGR